MSKAAKPIVSLARISILLFGVALLLGCGSVAAEAEPRGQVSSQKESAEGREKESLYEDFALTITVEEASLPQGENFRVAVALKNNSGEDQEIVYDILFWPTIPGWRPFEGVEIDPPEPQTRFFEANAVIGLWGSEGAEWLLGADLEPGIHELRFRARFWTDVSQDTPRQIEVWSNTVPLSVR